MSSRRLVHAEARRHGGEEIVDEVVELFLEKGSPKVDSQADFFHGVPFHSSPRSPRLRVSFFFSPRR